MLYRMLCDHGEEKCEICCPPSPPLIEVEGNPDPRVQKLLEDLSVVFWLSEIGHAVGGGVALLAYGVRRMTSDVDFFFDQGSIEKVMKVVKNMGLRIRSVAPPFHYVAFRTEDNPNWNPASREIPEIRADLMFPVGDPELSAVEFPDVVIIGGTKVNVFPVELLVAAKFLATLSNDPGMRLKHASDIAQLLAREAFSPADVKRMIGRYDREEAKRFEGFIRDLIRVDHKERFRVI